MIEEVPPSSALCPQCQRAIARQTGFSTASVITSLSSISCQDRSLATGRSLVVRKSSMSTPWRRW